MTLGFNGGIIRQSFCYWSGVTFEKNISIHIFFFFISSQTDRRSWVQPEAEERSEIKIKVHATHKESCISEDRIHVHLFKSYLLKFRHGKVLGEATGIETTAQTSVYSRGIYDSVIKHEQGGGALKRGYITKRSGVPWYVHWLNSKIPSAFCMEDWVWNNLFHQIVRLTHHSLNMKKVSFINY